jgi:hypothetical protein
MVKKVLIIEGQPGDLRQGFYKLFKKKLEGNMPQIVMGENNSKTLQELYKQTGEPQKRFALIDLDAPIEKKQNRLTALNVPKEYQEAVYFMVQEMEAWFFSQPEILDTHFRMNISNRIPKKHPSEIEKPAEKLRELSGKKYHKVKDAIKLLENLDANKLVKSFKDFSNLINALS